MAIEQTLERIERDLAARDYGRARNSLHGLISSYPDNLALRHRLGDVYWALQYPERAGRYWYLEEDKSPEMLAACRSFERACGDDPLQILFALKFRGDVQAIQETFAGRALLSLHESAKAKYSYYVDFRERGAKKYYNWPERPPSSLPGWLKIGCLLGLFLIITLIVIGLVTLWGWIF
jgi:hypothetical protein